MRDSSGIRHVPCGVCRECMQSRRRDWSIRSLFEFEDAIKKNWIPYFLTLTYDDEHLTRKLNVETGELVPVLNYDNWHQCTNYLRMAHSITADNYRYLLCGEYGNLHLRPHMHVLLFVDSSDIVQLLGDYWYEHFCPRAKKMIDERISDSKGIVYNWGQLGFVALPVKVTDPASPIRVARYVSKYVVKGSFDKTKHEYKEFYRKFPARVYASRGYGMSRLEYYREQLKHFKGTKRIKSKTFKRQDYEVIKTKHEHYAWTAEYLAFIQRTMRVFLGQDCRDPTKPYYAALPKAYFDRLLPKKMFLDNVIGFDSNGQSRLERVKHRVKEIPSTVSTISLQTAVSYYLQEDMLRKRFSNATRIAHSKDRLAISEQLCREDDIDRLRNDRLSAEFAYRCAADYSCQKDLQ